MRCSISATVALAVAFLFLTVSAPSVSSEDNATDNLIDNIIWLTENLERLQSTVDNLGIDIENLSILLSALQTQLGENTIADILAQLEELAQQFEEEEEEEETGNSMMVFAITKDGFTPLTFGFAPGSSMLMMLMLMQDGGGGLFGIQELPHEDTPILLMDSAGGLIPTASVTLYLAGENAFAPITLPVFGGISMILKTEGMIFGTVDADGYESVSFFARMGEATDGTTPTEDIYFMTVATMKVGEPNVLRAVDGTGKLVEGTVQIQDLDAEPVYQEGPNRPAGLSFIPGSESFTVRLIRDGEEIAMGTMQVPRPTGGGDPWGAVIGVLAVSVVAYLAYRYKIKGRGWWKRRKKPPLG